MHSDYTPKRGEGQKSCFPQSVSWERGGIVFVVVSEKPCICYAGQQGFVSVQYWHSLRYVPVVLWTNGALSAIMFPISTDCMPMIGRSAKEKPALSEKNSLATVLYIEDDRPSRVLVRRVLEAEGFRVLEAIDGPQGLDVAQIEQPELILVDINMPEMDGFEVTARLRALPELGAVPIVALTANVMKGDRERTLAAGCSGYIQKPIDVDLLPVQLAAFLRR